MAFQSSLFYVLLFCLWKGISPEQCETYVYQPPVTTFRIKNGSSPNCGLNDAEVFHRIINNSSGEINFNITLNGTLCVGEYIFEVTTLNSSHTRQKFVICTDTCNDNNGSVFTLNANKLNFDAIFIFTGQYQVALKNINGSKVWESKVLSLTTGYTPIKLQDINPLLHGSCYLIQNKNKLEVTIIANETLFLKPPEIEMFVVDSSVVNCPIGEFFHGNYPKHCSSTTKYQQTCVYTLNGSSREYSIYTKIGDPRCNIETLWGNISTMCVTFTPCPVKMGDPSRSPIGSTLKIVMGSVVLLAIVAAIIFLSIKQLRIRANRRRNSYKVRYNRQATNEEKEYLIIYARELEQFERVVDTLRRLLSCGNCSKVTTLYELDPNRCLDPRNWLENKIRDGSVSVILLLNVAAPYACNSDFVYRISHCFDYLFPCAMQLLQTYNERSYHNLYKVLTPEANPEAFLFVNVLTMYNVPQHISELLSDLKVIGEESRSFEELLKNECNAYHDYIINSPQYLQDIFVKKFFL